MNEELLIKAMTYDYPETLPISINFLPAAWLKYPDEIRALARKYSHIFGNLADTYDYNKNTPASYHVGQFRDEWGCLWSNVEEGMEAIVTDHPLKTRESVRGLTMPSCRDGRLPHGFMYLRLLDLRGFEEIMIDFAEEPEELRMLIDTVLDYNCIQIEARLGDPGKIMYFGDDLGMQNGLAIGYDKWMKYLFPCYKKMFGMARAGGKYVYMHTDGSIFEIMPELERAGVHMINPQFRANGLDNLVRVCKGKIPIFLDLDRQMFPFATPKELWEHVKTCVEALYMPEGGLGLNVELGKDVPLENMEAIICAVDEYRCYR